MADFGGDLNAFRTDVRDWLKANYPAELTDPAAGRPEAMWGGRAFAGSDDPQIVWMKRMAARGWTAPMWPKRFIHTICGSSDPANARPPHIASGRPAAGSFSSAG